MTARAPVLVVGSYDQDHAVRTETGWVLAFPAPTRPVSINEVSGRSRMGWRGLVYPWRQRVEQLATLLIEADPSLTLGDGGALPAITVQVGWQARGERRRDPHNYTGTVVKVVVDGLVRARLVADDNDRHVTVLDSAIVTVPMGTPRLWSWVSITPRQEGSPSSGRVRGGEYVPYDSDSNRQSITGSDF